MITVMELQSIFFLLSFLQGIYGQVTEPPSTAVARGEDVSLVCRSTEDNPIFTWAYVTEGQSLYTGTTRTTSIPRYDNIVLQEGTDARTSILNINAIELEEEGEYLCSTTTTVINPPNTVVTVEVGSASKNIDLNNIDNFANYTATCDAIGSKPEETITWILDGVTQTDGFVETDPDITADPLLFDKRSVFTFPASLDNYNVMLVCEISGHQASSIIPRQESRRVDVQNPPVPEGIVIGFDSDGSGTDLTVSCNTNDAVAAAIPPMDSFYIYSNGTLVPKPVADSTVTVTRPEYDTEFTCVGGNYLGNTTTTTTFEPISTTTPTPTTTAALEPTSNGGNETGSNGTGVTTTQPSMTTNENEHGTPSPAGLSAGAYAGIAIGVIACIVIIVVIVLYLLKPECCPCFGGSGPKSTGSSKPARSAVGSSNGSEKEKTRPQAAPRGHGSIQHTNDNPNQDMYAMVDKKKPGGDAPDRGSGPGQNEPQGMLYADLDLSHQAGHTEKHVPKNENDVVVYSSILV